MTTRDEVIKAAKEVGLYKAIDGDDDPVWLADDEELERFYAIAYNAGLAAQCQIKIPTNTMEQQFAHYQREGYKAGLERAAKICDRFGDRGMHPHECRDAIRKEAKK